LTAAPNNVEQLIFPNSLPWNFLYQQRYQRPA